MALPVALALASCDHRQQTWRGPIIPLQSVRIPQLVVEGTPAPSSRWTRCSCRFHREPARQHKLVTTSPAQQQPLHHPHVLTDPIGQGDIIFTPRATSRPASGAAPPPLSQVGSWKVAGTLVSCTIHLSSRGLLDVKRASVSGCQGSSLQNVNGWRSNGRTIELLEKGGDVPARFEQNQTGGFTSTTTDDGRKLTLYH
ncbi:AprI/Inh family metalloprotease inhibitor [Labrys miyagiensis]|uniref:AprI/Inh family metalloprotease inhibitor n=1 Tax=Labrys miyagiensis TaxID=346912 RepID=UPI003D673255